MRAPRWWAHPSRLAAWLAPLSLIYDLGTRLRMTAARPHRPPMPVICIGNVVAGGAGKTPMVLYLIAALQAQGTATSSLSRGYGGRLGGPLRVELERHGAAEVGDEPLLLAACTEAWIARDRVAGLKALAASGAACVIMDDGYQNPHVLPTARLLVVDGPAGLGNGRLLPAGPLREPWTRALAKADAVVIIGTDAQNVAQRCGDIPVLRAMLEPDTKGLDLTHGSWLAFAGIGRPEKFFTTLREAAAAVADTVAFPDHHSYTASELTALYERATESGARLITTEKDAVRLPPAWREQVAVLPVALRFDAASEAWLHGWLERLVPAPRETLGRMPAKA